MLIIVLCGVKGRVSRDRVRKLEKSKRQKSNIIIDLMLTVTRKSDEMESIMPYQHVILYFKTSLEVESRKWKPHHAV